MSSSKHCKKCNTLCSIGYFYKSKNKSYIDGKIDWCKPCVKEYIKIRNAIPKPCYKYEEKEVVFHFD